MNISGILPERLLADSSPYLATGDIYVAPGATVVIEPGVVILFEAFTGLHVQGTLIAQGAAGRPICFSSKNDKLLNHATELSAAPYDWNGIDLYETAMGTRFDYCTIHYSVYGIRSQTQYFRITSGSFRFNGKGEVSVKGERLNVGSEPFNYGIQVNEVRQQKVPLVVPEDRHAKKRGILRYGGVGLAAGGIAAGVVGLVRLTDSQAHFDEINEGSDLNLIRYTMADREQARKERNLDRAIVIAGAGIALMGASGFAVSFYF